MVTTQVFTSGLEQLPAMRCFLRDAWKRGQQAHGDSVDRTDAMHEMELALQEAASNVMIHAYGRQPGGPIRLTIENDGGQVIVSIHHRGRGFDRAGVAQPKFDGSRFGGFGVYLIEQLCDRCEYLSDDAGGHHVRLVKFLESPAAVSAS